jgi:hypothetical protein
MRSGLGGLIPPSTLGSENDPEPPPMPPDDRAKISLSSFPECVDFIDAFNVPAAPCANSDVNGPGE